jgi:hypothetical protein
MKPIIARVSRFQKDSPDRRYNRGGRQHGTWDMTTPSLHWPGSIGIKGLERRKGSVTPANVKQCLAGTRLFERKMEAHA